MKYSAQYIWAVSTAHVGASPALLQEVHVKYEGFGLSRRAHEPQH